MDNQQLLDKAATLSAQYKNREVFPISFPNDRYAFILKPDFHTQLKIIDSLRAGNSAVVCNTALDNLVIINESSAGVMADGAERLKLGQILLATVETTDAEIIKKN